MYLFVVATHVILCIFMVLIILLQPSKGEVGVSFGGGGGGTNGVFGPRGPASILQRVTTIVAVMFMGTSISLALYSTSDADIDSGSGDESEQVERDMRQKREADVPADAPDGAPDAENPGAE